MFLLAVLQVSPTSYRYTSALRSAMLDSPIRPTENDFDTFADIAAAEDVWDWLENPFSATLYVYCRCNYQCPVTHLSPPLHTRVKVNEHVACFFASKCVFPSPDSDCFAARLLYECIDRTDFQLHTITVSPSRHTRPGLFSKIA